MNVIQRTYYDMQAHPEDESSVRRFIEEIEETRNIPPTERGYYEMQYSAWIDQVIGRDIRRTYHEMQAHPEDEAFVRRFTEEIEEARNTPPTEPTYYEMQSHPEIELDVRRLVQEIESRDFTDIDLSTYSCSGCQHCFKKYRCYGNNLDRDFVDYQVRFCFNCKHEIYIRLFAETNCPTCPLTMYKFNNDHRSCEWERGRGFSQWLVVYNPAKLFPTWMWLIPLDRLFYTAFQVYYYFYYNYLEDYFYARMLAEDEEYDVDSMLQDNADDDDSMHDVTMTNIPVHLQQIFDANNTISDDDASNNDDVMVEDTDESSSDESTEYGLLFPYPS